MGRKLAFEWDEHNKAHLARHGVSPREFEEVFSGFMIEQIVERAREKRVAAIGKTKAGRYLFLAYAMRAGRIRPVTAYTLPRSRRKDYEEKIKKL
jgi:uncharacterized DUF497 family protein